MIDKPKKFERTILTGPPGCGKTRAVIDAFNRARASGCEHRVLFIVPDSSALEHMRDIIARNTPDGVPKIFSDSGMHTPKSLAKSLGGRSDAGAVDLIVLAEKWVIENERIKSAWPIFETPGGRRALVESVMRLREYGIDSSGLISSVGRLIGPNHPLIELSRQWENWLKNSGKKDEALVWNSAFENVDRIDCDVVIIDGFTEIPPLQWKVISAIIERAPRAIAALDPTQPPSDELFKNFIGLGFSERKMPHGSRWCEKVILCDLAKVESWGITSDLSGLPDKIEIGNRVKIIEAGDARLEAAAIAEEIARLIGEGFSYSDIAVIAPNLGEFSPVLESEFRRAGIPLRNYSDRPLSQTSPGRLIDSALALCDGEWTDEKVGSLLVHGGVGIELDDVRKALRFVDIERRLGDIDSWLDWSKINGVRFHDLLTGLVKLAKSSELNAGTFAGKIIELIEPLLRISWREMPDESVESEAWAWGKIKSALLSNSFSHFEISGKRTPSKIAEFLRCEIEKSNAKPYDRRQDCVNALTLLASRTWSVPVAIVCGLSRNSFPRKRSPDTFLTDEIRTKLDPPIPSVSELRDREEALFRIAVTRATERLVLTRPVADYSGSPLLESVPLKRFRERLGINPVMYKLNPPANISETVFARDLVLIAFENGITDSAFISKIDSRYRDEIPGPISSDNYAKAVYSDNKRLVASALGSKEKPISATHINNLAQCSYKFFASRILGLREPDTGRIGKGLSSLIWGNIAHDALANWHRSNRKADFTDLVESAAKKHLAGIPLDSEIESKKRQIVYALERFRVFEEKYLSPLGFGQKFAELSFGKRHSDAAKEDKLEPVEIAIDNNYSIILGGRIDRVDIADENRAIVFDYKRSFNSIGKDIKRLKDNRDFQLACYIALVSESLKLKPVAALFLPLIESGTRKKIEIIADESISELFDENNFKRIDGSDGPLDCVRHLKKSYEEIAALIDSISTGDITPSPKDTDLCEYCPYEDLCRVQISEDAESDGGGE
ncbi:MAG: PD-(D/E)XK nuclease family protein, partial [bacterium]